MIAGGAILYRYLISSRFHQKLLLSKKYIYLRCHPLNHLQNMKVSPSFGRPVAGLHRSQVRAKVAQKMWDHIFIDEIFYIPCLSIWHDNDMAMPWHDNEGQGQGEGSVKGSQGSWLHGGDYCLHYSSWRPRWDLIYSQPTPLELMKTWGLGQSQPTPLDIHNLPH